MNPAKRAEIFARLRAANPTPTTELNYATTFVRRADDVYGVPNV